MSAGGLPTLSVSENDQKLRAAVAAEYGFRLARLYSEKDAAGFIKLNALRLRTLASRKRKLKS